MGRPLRQLLRLAAETDAEASVSADGWYGRCLHCRARLVVGTGGDPRGSTTLEHIVPRAWFGRRHAQDLVADLDGPDDPRNLALACARCNQQKGHGPDARGPADPGARALVERLLARRQARFRPPSAAPVA